jgi:hypothetical protein
MPVAESGYMINFWEDHRFYLLAFKRENIVNNVLNIARIFRRFGTLFFVYPVLFILGLSVSWRRRDYTTIIVSIAVLLLLIASHLGKYPMEPRLYMFAYTLIILYSIVCLNYVFARFSGRKLIFGFACFLSFALVINNSDFVKYAKDRVYIETHEVNPLIEYVRNNIKDGEYLYASSSASYVLRFKNGYNSNRIGSVSHDNIVYGGSEDDVTRIVDAQKAYLLFQRRPSGSFLEELKTRGNLHEVGSYYQTPLYYFSTDGNDPNLAQTFESIDFQDDVTVVFRFALKPVIEILVKSDDETDKLIVYIYTYMRGDGITPPRIFYINRP